MSIKYLSTLSLILILISCSSPDDPTNNQSKNTIENTITEDISIELAMANKQFNDQVDSISMENQTVIDFVDFQLVFFEFKNNPDFQYKSGDTIFIEAEKGNKIGNFIILNPKPDVKYSAWFAYEQSINTSTNTNNSLELLAWRKIADFAQLNQHDNLNLHYTLPEYWNNELTLSDYEQSFEALKQDVIAVKTEFYVENNQQEISDLSITKQAKEMDDLNLAVHNNKVLVKVIQKQKDDSVKEFVLVLNRAIVH